MIPDFTRPTLLFGGSFDPVHLGHLHVARTVSAALPGWRLIFVPAFLSPGKQPPFASPAQRIQWLRMAVEGSDFGVWDTELERAGMSYTVDTLKEAHRLGAERENLKFLLGADAYGSFSQWKNPAEIRALAGLVVVNRPGNSLISQELGDLVVTIPPHSASSTAIRRDLQANSLLVKALPDPVQSELERLIALSQNPYTRNMND